MRWLVLAALCVGCKGKKPPPKHDDARIMPADAAVADAAVDAAPDAWQMSTTITSDGVGPITADTNDADDFERLMPGYSAKSEHHEAEDYSYDEILVTKNRLQILRAVVQDKSLFKVEVDDATFTTASGVSVGTPVAELAAKIADIKCVYETYDPEADAERVDRSLRCGSEKLPRVLFEIDYEKFKGPEGTVSTKTIGKRKVVQIVWLADKD
ncbi:MAG TPA: DUF1131 family protein [Kofleriaceae bacterium]|nr:DUF1131 family protein [Kofleriaceae bacterium]